MMDSASWLGIWAWLADSAAAGTRGTSSSAGEGAGTRTGTPSSVVWEGNHNNISFSRHGFEPLTAPLPLSTIDNSGSSPAASSSIASSSASGSGFNFLALDAEQQQHPSLTATDTSNHNLNTTETFVTSRSLAALDTFLLCSPSTSTFDAAIEHESDRSGSRHRRSRSLKMPSLTYTALDEPYFSNSTSTASNTTANTSQWRPRSGRSARSASPLFARWARRHHQQHEHAQDSNDSRSSTDRKSTSSSGNSKRVHDDYTDASHKHMCNFSTSTMRRTGSSSRRQSQAGLPPPLTREEFEALPLAIQRKVRAVSGRLSHC